MDEKWFEDQKKRVGRNDGDIAARAGKHRSVVSKIVAGKQRMSLDWARAFAEVLDLPVATILEKAGVADRPLAHQLAPGFAESDAGAWVAGPGMAEAAQVKSVAAALGGDRPGVDVWRVRSQAMALDGMKEGDFMLVDTHQSERVSPGDLVVANIYNRTGAVTVLRRYEPPVLVAASLDPDEARVHVVDGVNVVIRGKVVASWRV